MNPDIGALSGSKRVTVITTTRFPTPAHLPESEVERFSFRKLLDILYLIAIISFLAHYFSLLFTYSKSAPVVLHTLCTRTHTII